MKLSVLSGAYINAGDFLIVDRTIKLLEHIYPDCEITIYKRNESLKDELDKINNSDALILAGGPAYVEDAYPNIFRLVDNLDEIKTKIVSIGLGWYGKNITDKFIYNYRLSDQTKNLFERVMKDSSYLSCRDWYSTKILYINGLNQSIMTGCPAWYNIEKINQTQIEKPIKIKKICISDPANNYNFNGLIKLVKRLKDKYKEAEIYFIFHRIETGSKKYLKLQSKLKSLQVKLVDISGSVEGFKIYNDCDLHIGYRVHAHIYNLSERNISVLIEEDGRGTGVNEALGLYSIKAYKTTNKIIGKNIFEKGVNRIYTILGLRNNKHLITDVFYYLEMLENNDYSQINSAFIIMKYYYKRMENYIKNTLNAE